PVRRPPPTWPDDPLRERRRSDVPGGADVAALVQGELLTGPVGVPPCVSQVSAGWRGGDHAGGPGGDHAKQRPSRTRYPRRPAGRLPRPTPTIRRGRGGRGRRSSGRRAGRGRRRTAGSTGRRGRGAAGGRGAGPAPGRAAPAGHAARARGRAAGPGHRRPQVVGQSPLLGTGLVPASATPRTRPPPSGARRGSRPPGPPRLRCAHRSTVPAA